MEGLQPDETLLREYNALVRSWYMFDEAIDVLFQMKKCWPISSPIIFS